jgi:hypothetical protein
MTPSRINASFWRCWLVRVAFRLPHSSRLSRLCWRASRVLATEDTHAALAAYCSGLIMAGVMSGDM